MAINRVGNTIALPKTAPARAGLALLTILAAQFMFAMDLLIVVVALPRIQHDLGFSPAGLTWVLNAFGLAFGGLLLLGGRLGDMLGQLRAFRTGILVFVLASLLGGLAQSPGWLIVARVFQGAGAALAGPSVLALVMAIARSEKEQARGMTLFIAVSSVGASAGLMLGGVLTELFSWRWALLINVPLGTIIMLTVGRLVANTRPQRARLDIGGALTATFGSVALVYGFISAAEHGLNSFGTVLSFAAALPLFLTFLRIERVHQQPLLDLHLLRDHSRLGALAVMALIVGVHFAVLFTLVQYFQRALGYPPMVAGLAYLPLTATVFAISHFVPRLLIRFGAPAACRRKSAGGCQPGGVCIAWGNRRLCVRHPAAIAGACCRHCVGLCTGHRRHHARRGPAACRRRFRHAANGSANRWRTRYCSDDVDLRPCCSSR